MNPDSHRSRCIPRTGCGGPQRKDARRHPSQGLHSLRAAAGDNNHYKE